MKSLTPVFMSIVCLSLSASIESVSAAPKKVPAAATTDAPATAPAVTPAKASRTMPMHVKVDTIDAAAKSFTHTTKKGTKVTNRLTAASIVMQGDKPANFSDLKVGDYVSGSHLKKSDTDYEIVKITKFGPEAPKTEAKATGKKP